MKIAMGIIGNPLVIITTFSTQAEDEMHRSNYDKSESKQPWPVYLAGAVFESARRRFAASGSEEAKYFPLPN